MDNLLQIIHKGILDKRLSLTLNPPPRGYTKLSIIEGYRIHVYHIASYTPLMIKRSISIFIALDTVKKYIEKNNRYLKRRNV